MLARGEIGDVGLLNPLMHIPDGPFLSELSKRGIQVSDTTTWES
jgi:hypothetical protein